MITPRTLATRSEIAELVERHLPLVGVLVSERLRTGPAHIWRDDLMSAGTMALVQSAAAYDAQRGVPFRSFAAFRIRGALIDELRAMDWASRSVRNRARELETARAHLSITLNRAPASHDIAGAMGISTRELDAVYSDLSRATVVSLGVFDGNAASRDTEGPESLILKREKLGYLHDAIASLPERLRFVVVAYYFRHRQMSDIAAELSLTQSRVSQLCTEATAWIRDGMNAQLEPKAERSTHTGRAATARKAYCQAVADRNTVSGRLQMSTSQGEMHQFVYAEPA